LLPYTVAGSITVSRSGVNFVTFPTRFVTGREIYASARGLKSLDTVGLKGGPYLP
jgi:hypothetical protein